MCPSASGHCIVSSAAPSLPRPSAQHAASAQHQPNSAAVQLRAPIHKLGLSAYLTDLPRRHISQTCACNLPISQTYNYGVDSYDLGEGFGHFGIGEP